MGYEHTSYTVSDAGTMVCLDALSPGISEEFTIRILTENTTGEFMLLLMYIILADFFLFKVSYRIQ